MLQLSNPEFGTRNESVFGGAPVLLALWQRLDFSLLLTQSGIFRIRGLTTWKLAFAMVVSMINQCSSDLARVTFWNEDALLKAILSVKVISQSSMSRFLNDFSQWQEFTRLRILRLQGDSELKLEEGDIIALDDTLIAHPFGKSLPFVSKLFDHSQKMYVYGMNLLALHAVKQNGREYPLFNSFWVKSETEEPSITKFILATQALKKLRAMLPDTMRLWVSMDRWFFSKSFFDDLESLHFDWVTKTKRNTVFYRLVPNCSGGSKPCYVKVTATEIIRQHYHQLLPGMAKGLVAFAVNNLYLQISEPKPNAKGPNKNRTAYKPVGGVVALRLTEDETEENKVESASSDVEPAAVYKGAYLLVSNRTDVPEKLLAAYQKRWRIELLFRNAKSELGLCKCHSSNENHVEAHVAMLFTAETLVRLAEWEYNAKMDPDKSITHGKMSNLIFRTHCTLDIQPTHDGDSDAVYLYFDIAVRKFASFFERFWPRSIELKWFIPANWNQLPSSD